MSRRKDINAIKLKGKGQESCSGARAVTSRWRFGGKEIAGQKVGASAVLVAPAGTPAAAAGRPYLDFGARLYDPRTAAWLSQDPMAEKYYPISPYAYCAGNPVNLVDPDGMDWYYLHQDGTITFGFEDNYDEDNDYLVLGYWEKDSVGPSLSIRVPKAVNLGGLSQDISSANLSHAISSSDESIIDLFVFVIHHSEKREWAIASFKGEDGSRTYGLVQGKKGASVMSPSEIAGLDESRMTAKIHTHWIH
ncbi:MAG: RHS repeat-associated core domain-containing protein [Bacteroidales bacterium]|nr:RHS repeat-associated core domain-containing protein [Bacteroidales bacterium]